MIKIYTQQSYWNKSTLPLSLFASLSTISSSMAFHDHLSHEMALHHFTDQHLTDNTAVLRGIFPEHSPEGAGKQPHITGGSGGGGGAPTWLNSAILRQQSGHHHYGGGGGGGGEGRFLHLQTTNNNMTNSDSSASNNQWLSRSIHGDNDDVPTAAMLSHRQQKTESDGGGGGEDQSNWQNAKCKADILAHPLYEQLLSTHVQCLRIATPVDQLPRIDAQLAQSEHVMAKYSVLGHGNQPLDDKDLDQFMTHYVLLLSSFKEQLQQHVRVHAMEAVMACWELEQSLQSLTGVAPGEGTGATMSDDDDDEHTDGDANLFDGSLDGQDTMGFGPLVPTENERSLMERVRHELKHELKQGYKEKIVDIREEILRKRRAGKLPGDTTSLLKAWWQSHSKWPYPTEEDKARLVQETGLQLKQINNWFINQRKRNWHSNPSSSTTTKSKRKSSNAGESRNDRFA
ncbi:homeobox protein knotted-1-like 2 isoform X3 [Rhododendron vialii]|uniref:homeobox protein knotted-1-like 2 isoform X3 n=1 Tax=Rhododendron vialii TaxID=182163 RepID=UPI00265FCEAC|nr:homeobox protein knotted-1-like 2 isoform X3 [Rhododendron vialii]